MAGVLLLCAYLMSGPGHADTMRMPAVMDGMGMGMGIGSGTPAMMVNGSASSHGPAASDRGGDGCPVTAMECPLASAQTPVSVSFTAPGPAVLAEAPVLTARPALPLDVSCAWPRAPDPVSLLCVSRT